jgi:hypothetical protein
LRKFTLAGVISGLAAFFLLAPGALAQSGGGCQLNGTASFSPGLNSSLLAFEPPDPTACNTPAGVTSAGISGLVALGSTS